MVYNRGGVHDYEPKIQTKKSGHITCSPHISYLLRQNTDPISIFLPPFTVLGPLKNYFKEVAVSSGEPYPHLPFLMWQSSFPPIPSVASMTFILTQKELGA